MTTVEVSYIAALNFAANLSDAFQPAVPDAAGTRSGALLQQDVFSDRRAGPGPDDGHHQPAQAELLRGFLPQQRLQRRWRRRRGSLAG